MQISSPTGLLNVFIEPQFKNLCAEPIFTVQAPDIKSLAPIRPPSFAEFTLLLNDPLFQFNAFVYSWNLEHILSDSKIKQIDILSVNVNPEPKAFSYEIEVFEDEVLEDCEEDGDCIGTLRVGYFLASQLETMLPLFREYSDEFKIYPLYRDLSEHELTTVWIS